MLAPLQHGQDVIQPPLVVAVQNQHMAEPTLRRIGEGGLVRAPQMIVAPVAGDNDGRPIERRRRLPGFVDRGIATAVVQHQHLGDVRNHVSAKLSEHATDLRRAIEAGDEEKNPIGHAVRPMGCSAKRRDTRKLHRNCGGVTSTLALSRATGPGRRVCITCTIKASTNDMRVTRPTV